MYEITVEGRFSAAHRHRGAGNGRDVHGHDFLVLARVAGEALVDDVLVDFHDVELSLKRHLTELHYRDLDALGLFPGREATPLVIARWLFERLQGDVALQAGASLTAIEVRDGEWTGARYSEDPD